jgi:hypothetical protein
MEEVYDQGVREERGDKWIHFEVSRRVTSETTFGFIYVLPVGALKEYWDNVWPPRDWPDSVMDMACNIAGWWAGL